MTFGRLIALVALKKYEKKKVVFIELRAYMSVVLIAYTIKKRQEFRC